MTKSTANQPRQPNEARPVAAHSYAALNTIEIAAGEKVQLDISPNQFQQKLPSAGQGISPSSSPIRIMCHENSEVSVLCSMRDFFTDMEVSFDLIGTGANARLVILTALEGDSRVTITTHQNHHAPGATSDVLCLNALDGQSRLDFCGTIFISPEAQQSRAYQKAKTLLLSKAATIHARPALEILANDIQCSHGATASGIDPDQLFYLATRGIPEKIARSLLLDGFFQNTSLSSQKA